jgi:hypothetical protein
MFSREHQHLRMSPPTPSTTSVVQVQPSPVKHNASTATTSQTAAPYAHNRRASGPGTGTTDWPRYGRGQIYCGLQNGGAFTIKSAKD